MRKISMFTKLWKAGLEIPNKVKYALDAEYYVTYETLAKVGFYSFMAGVPLPWFADRFFCIFCLSKRCKELGSASPCYQKRTAYLTYWSISVKSDPFSKS